MIAPFLAYIVSKPIHPHHSFTQHVTMNASQGPMATVFGPLKVILLSYEQKNVNYGRVTVIRRAIATQSRPPPPPHPVG